MNQIILFIRSSEHEQVELSLLTKNKIIKISKFVQMGTMADKFLLILDKFLAKNEIALKDLNAITIYAGPGSYTSLRIGLSVANALAFALDIPVVALRKTESFSKKLPAILSYLKKHKKFVVSADAYYQQAIN